MAISRHLQSRIDYSIKVIRKAERLALTMNPDGFWLAFSGGKDSQVLYHLALMAGVKFKAHMNLTSIDPPQVIRFVRGNYRRVNDIIDSKRDEIIEELKKQSNENH